MGYLTRVFHATEEANRRAILRELPVRPGAGLLDLGTSDGEFTSRVAQRVGAGRVAGVELLERHAQRARARGIDVRTTDLDEGLPFGDHEFEVVHANQVIEHVRRTDLLLREIRRVLVPGGVACISTNNLASWHNVFSLALGLQPMPIHVSDELILGNPLSPEDRWAHRDRGRTHLRLFTIRALTDLCDHHGLERVRTRTVGYYPLPPALSRIASRLDPVHGAFAIGLFRPVERFAQTDGALHNGAGPARAVDRAPRSAQPADRPLEGVEGGLRSSLEVEETRVQAPEVAEDRRVGLRVPPGVVDEAP
jgi:SAM-dependent methyltransferase